MNAAVWGWSTRQSRFKAVHILAYLAIIAADIVFTLAALWSWPPLVAFTQFLGYFAGSIYDEAIDVTRALVLYRIGTLFAVLCFCIAQVRKPGWRRRFLMPVAAIAIAFGWHVGLSQLGFIPPMGRTELSRTLWQEVSNDAGEWTVHFMPSSKSQAALKRETEMIRREYDANYQKLKAFFHNRTTGPIDI